MRGLRGIKLGLSALLLAGGLLLGLQPQKAQAEVEQKRGSTSFFVKPNTSIEDKDGRVATNKYFALNYGPGESHTIDVKVTSTSDKAIKVYSKVLPATMADGPVLNFSNQKSGLDKSLKYNVADYVKPFKGQEVITLKSGETKTVKFNVKTPPEKFRGMIYGVLQFTRNQPKAQADTVTSNYQYQVGMMLTGSPYRVYPELKYVDTKPMIFNGYGGMGIQLRNSQPMLIKNAKVTATITKTGLFSSKHVMTQTNVDIAPNSTFKIPVSWNFDKLRPGTYQVDVAVKGQNFANQLPMVWHFKKTIKTKSNDVETVNDQRITKPISNWAYVAIASGIVFLGAVGLQIYVTKKF